ncbi:toxin HicA [Corynebacterium vitaeruminis]|uniref:toxin HicA n=1 Tax=Corynebacterium vitaeruminis TaxID=38305 RepID=UPI0023F0AF37|nr:toxin HicA [Corynebacterium vitaeruminis]
MVDKLDKIIARMRKSNSNIPYADLRKVCDHYFDRRPSSGGDHETYKTPWAGDPRVNIQNRNGKAKPYQVAQVLKALDRLELHREAEE